MAYQVMWAQINHGKPDRWKTALLYHKMTLIMQFPNFTRLTAETTVSEHQI